MADQAHFLAAAAAAAADDDDDDDDDDDGCDGSRHIGIGTPLSRESCAYGCV